MAAWPPVGPRRIIYQAQNRRFYACFDRQSAQFHVFDVNRPDWRVVSSSLAAAADLCDRYDREASRANR